MTEFLEALRRALRSPAFKFFLTVFLILLLAIPLLLVYALVWERESRAQAVRAEGERKFVFVVKDGVVEQRDVKADLVSPTLVRVREGVALEEQVVVEGAAGLKAGARVKVASS